MAFTGVKPAHAAGTYDNATIADRALQYVGQWGGNACADAHKPGGGQCKQFVNCIVWMASNGAQWPAPGYNSGFQNAGGIEVTGASAVKGDIIQVGDSSPLHTAIVVLNLGGGNYDVVDSNFGTPTNNEIVHHHTWTPPSNARFWRMGTVYGAPNPHNPIGSFDGLWRVPGGFRIGGWATDPDTARTLCLFMSTSTASCRHLSQPATTAPTLATMPSMPHCRGAQLARTRSVSMPSMSASALATHS
jgi:hypothetical protein